MALQGLTSLTSLTQIEEDTPELTAEELHGGPADPSHGQWGEASQPYPWESMQTPAGSHQIIPDDGLIDDASTYAILDAGVLTDDPTSERAPWTHAAPWPKDPIGDGSTQPDNTIRQITQNASIHASQVGGKRNVQVPTMDPVNDHWSEIWQVDPNSSDLEQVGPQMRSGLAPGGRGQTDRTQSNARQNGYGFDGRHIHRRFATGSIPGNYMWMKPGGRPMVKSLPGPARPAIGPGSPFEGQDMGAAFGTDGAILTQNPVTYTPPPSPALANGYQPDTAPIDYADMYGSA